MTIWSLQLLTSCQSKQEGCLGRHRGHSLVAVGVVFGVALGAFSAFFMGNLDLNEALGLLVWSD